MYKSLWYEYFFVVMKNGGFSTFDKLYLYSVESWLAYYILKINLKLILAIKSYTIYSVFKCS